MSRQTAAVVAKADGVIPNSIQMPRNSVAPVPVDVTGPAPSWGTNSPGDALVFGEIVGTKLTFTRTLRNGTDTYTYIINPDGTLSARVGVKFNDGRTGGANGRMKRVPL